MLTIYRDWLRVLLFINRRHMEQQKKEVLPGALKQMVLKTLSMHGPMQQRASEIMVRFFEPSEETI
jgi:hypothetical protein